MDSNKTHCALCTTLLEKVKFNLKYNNSKYSNLPLLSLIEDVVGELSVLHFDICLQCYDLLNEFEVIKLRQIEIQTQFKKYLENSNKISNPSKSITLSEINDSSLYNCDDVTENDLPEHVTEAEIEIKTEPPHLESVDVLENCSTTEENIPIPDKERTENPIIKRNWKRRKHRNPQKTHKCHCSKEFKTAGELKNHMNTHNEHRAFICEICGQSYKCKSAFNIHIDMHYGIHPFTCVYCNKSFTQKGSLARHVPIHTGEMPYQCDLCGKRFVHHTSFNVHRLSHTGMKSHKCSLCGLALTSASHLKRHMRIHTGEKKFACDTCGKRFAERYNLIVHTKLHNNPCSDVSQKSSYSCQICGVNFERKMKLDEHLVNEHQMMMSELCDKGVLMQEA